MTEKERKALETYHAALKGIRDYQNPAQLRRSCGKLGLEFEETLEMAYDSMQCDAANALAMYRMPPKKRTK